MIEAAEDEGKLRPGGTVVESDSRQHRFWGLALVARREKATAFLLVIPDKMSQEKKSRT